MPDTVQRQAASITLILSKDIPRHMLAQTEGVQVVAEPHTHRGLKQRSVCHQAVTPFYPRAHEYQRSDSLQMPPQRTRYAFDDTKSESSGTRDKATGFTSAITGPKIRRNGQLPFGGSSLRDVTSASHAIAASRDFQDDEPKVSQSIQKGNEDSLTQFRRSTGQRLRPPLSTRIGLLIDSTHRLLSPIPTIKEYY